MNGRWVAVLVVLGLVVLHHDAWFWDDGTLVAGVLPIGLAWHGGFSLLAALAWWVVSTVAWPGDPLGDDGGDA